MTTRQMILICSVSLAGCGIEPTPNPASFSLTVLPAHLAPAIPQQECVLLLSIAEEEPAQSGSQAVELSGSAPNCEVAIEPAVASPGQTAEVTVIPNDATVNTTVVVTVRGERAGEVRTTSASFEVWEGEDTVADEATTLRDRFTQWLATSHLELGIDSDIQWTGIVVRPIWLVVTHYMFFSDEWEMGVSWHIMIPPYDWARIYLRHRFDEAQPSYAFEISSRSDAAAQPHAIDPPTEVAR